jgi:hypothetical protein
VSSTFRISSKSALLLLFATFLPTLLSAQSGLGALRAGRASRAAPAAPNSPPVAVSPGAWSQLGQLVPNVANNYFAVAYSVAIDGDTIVVGAFPTLTKNNGSAYVFTKPANGWSNLRSVASLNVPSEGGASSVAIQGDTIVVGVGNDTYGPGAAYVFQKPATGWTDMNPTATLSSTNSLTGDYFGNSVGISGNAIVVGAPGDNSYIGNAYIYVEPANGWTDMTETATLKTSDGATDDFFGESVSISANTVVSGAGQYSQAAGKVYVYTEPAGGWTNMTQTARLTSSNGRAGNSFGGTVSISANTILVGETGADRGQAYVFVKPSTGWVNTTQTAILSPGDGSSEFGGHVLISGQTAVVGAPLRSPGVNFEEGGAYIFSEPKGGWKNMSSTTVLTASDARHFSWLGDALAIDGNTLVVGAPAFQFNGTAFVFGLP